MEQIPRQHLDKTKEEKAREEAYEKAELETIEETREMLKKQTLCEITEDSEYFKIHYPNKTKMVPKKRYIPLFDEKGRKNIDLEIYMYALIYFSDDSMSNAIEKISKKATERFPNELLQTAIKKYVKECSEQ